MRVVTLGEIRIDGGTQVRAAINESVVTEYAERMSAGTPFPPIVLFHDGSVYHLADGFHRTLASQRLGLAEIAADVQTGTKEDAVWFALGANKANGHRMTGADKKHAVILAFQVWPDMSGSRIADQIGCDQAYVQRLRAQVMTSHNLPDRVTGKDGKSYPASRSDKKSYPPPRKSRIPDERRTEAILRLKRGDRITAIAAELRMSSRTVRKIGLDAGIPLKRDDTRDGIRQRYEQIRTMATEGYTSRQIAIRAGMTLESCRKAMREAGIDVPADRAVGKVKHHDSTRIVEHIVMDAENLTADVNLIDFGDFHPSKLAGWIVSLTTSRKSLDAFIRQLVKEQEKHGEAA